MRLEDIKFRAKRHIYGEWVEGDLHHYKDSVFIIPTKGINKFRNLIVDPSTVCQYTGLKDSKGQEIWENDIIEVNTTKGEILWSEEELAFVVLYEYATEPTSHLAFVKKHSALSVLRSKFDKEV